MLLKLNNLLQKRENWIIVLFMIIFIFVNMQGLYWGIPDHWNVDEVVQYAENALKTGRPNFDETSDLSYPSLPKYILYGLGKIVYAFGYSYHVFRYAARLLSVLLGSVIIGLIYKITRQAGGKPLSACLATLLAMTSSELALNAHFAHNDMYVVLFSLLAIFLLLEYRRTTRRSILYAAFFTIGLAASCKYPAAALILAGLGVWVFTRGKTLLQEKLRSVETLFISACLSFLGFAAGTPKALLWMTSYFGDLTHSFYLLSNYNRTEATQTGFTRQWGILNSAMSTPVFVLVILCLLACFIFLLGSFLFKKTSRLPKITDGTIVLLMAVVALDIPMMLSYDVKARFFLTVILVLFIICSLIVELLIETWLEPKHHVLTAVLSVGMIILIFVTSLRIVSVILLFENDARIAAGEYLETLPVGSTLEYTIYHPSIPSEHFFSHEYPLEIIKYPDQIVPVLEDERYRYNQGETGLLNRHPDYLVVDNFTYDRFQDPYVCQWNQVECDFFERLLAEETDYRLLAVFTYSLPAFLPDLSLSFLNPEIRIYQRNY